MLTISSLLPKPARLNLTIFRHSAKNAIGEKGVRMLRKLIQREKT
jgi:hypothetical protein